MESFFGEIIAYVQLHKDEFIIGAFFLLASLAITVLPKIINSYSIKRRVGDISGEWISYWDSRAGGKINWISEDIKLSRKIFGGYKIIAENNSDDHEWEGVGDFETSYVFSGMWESTRFGSKSKGGVMLLRCSEGLSLFGHWYGFSPNTILTEGMWLMVPKGIDPVPEVKKRLTGHAANKLIKYIAEQNKGTKK